MTIFLFYELKNLISFGHRLNSLSWVKSKLLQHTDASQTVLVIKKKDQKTAFIASQAQVNY